MNIYIDELPLRQEDNTWVAIDTELFGMEDGKLHRPNNGTFACLQIAIDEDVYIITNENIVDIALGRIDNCIWVMQKAKFDLTHLRRWSDIPRRKKLWDTLLIERILYGGYFENFSLADLTRRDLDIHLDKEVREEFETATELSDDLLQYSAKDAYYTLKVAKEQKKRIDEKDFRVWKEVDLPALWAIMDFKGFRLDVEAWTKLAHSHEDLAQEYKDTFDLNPASPKQVKEKLNELGARVDSTRADILEDLIDDDPDSEIANIAKRVLEYRSKAKLASTYGMNWIEKYVEEDGRIYSDYKVTGASTGRTASSNPNAQNIPVRNTPEFRKCFVPSEGNKLIVLDYSAQEPRIMAYLAQDEKMINIFNEDKDVYCESYYLMEGKRIGKDSKERKDTKPIVLGAGYGLSPYGYAQRYGGTKKEAEAKLGKFFSAFPDVKNWTYHQEAKNDYVETVMGRKFHLNPYSYQVKRHARNAPIQGTAADQLKKALGELHENWPEGLCEYGIVAQVHDEIIADVPEEVAEEVAKIMERTMERVAEEMCPGISFKAQAQIVDNWGEGK